MVLSRGWTTTYTVLIYSTTQKGANCSLKVRYSLGGLLLYYIFSSCLQNFSGILYHKNQRGDPLKFTTQKGANCSQKVRYFQWGMQLGGAFGPAGGRWSEWSPLVVSRTVGSALARRPKNRPNEFMKHHYGYFMQQNRRNEFMNQHYGYFTIIANNFEFE